MIGTARGAIIAIVLAIVLAGLALADALRSPRPPIDRALIPKFAAERLAWDGGETLVHDLAGWHATSGAVLDRDAVDAVITTLRGARWQRIAPREAAGALGPQLHVGDRTTLAVGQPLAGTEQVWIVRDDAALLVDGWVARSITVQPWQLHVRRPFADVEGDLTLVEGGRTIELVGRPRKVDGKWIDPVLSAQLDDALRAIEIVGPGGTGATAAAPQSITVKHGAMPATLVELGPCAGHPDRIAVSGLVDGCIAESPWRTIQAIARVLDGADARADGSGLDLRPLPIAATGIHFPDGDLDLGKPPHLTIAGATYAIEPGAVSELLAALSTRGERAAIPTGAPHTLVVHTAQSDVTLAVHAPDLVLRDDRVSIRVSPAIYAILARGARSYRLRTLWSEDPTTIARLVVDGTTFDRGAVLGEWPTAKDAAGIVAYLARLAHAQALDADPPTTFATVHRVAFDVESPDGRRETHALELGAPIASGCPARLGGAPIVIARELCSPPR